MNRSGRSVLPRTLALSVTGPLLLALAGLVHPGGLTPDTAAEWTTLHVWLVPVWPLLALGLIVPLWGRPERNAAGAATVLAWAGAYGYAAFYTALDCVAGIAAGTALRNTGSRSAVRPLYDLGDTLGYAGVYCLAAAVLAAAVPLFRRHGARVLPGVLVLLGCCWSFYDSHIFMPRGVLTMLGFALGFGLLAWAAARPGARPAGQPAG